jgi:hypothetical protein
MHCFSRRFYFAEVEAWFIVSFEAWKKAKKLENFILLAHCLGGLCCSKICIDGEKIVLKRTWTDNMSRKSDLTQIMEIIHYTEGFVHTPCPASRTCTTYNAGRSSWVFRRDGWKVRMGSEVQNYMERGSTKPSNFKPQNVIRYQSLINTSDGH